MEFSSSFSRLVLLLGISLLVVILPVHGQTNSGCTPAMVTSVTPCLNFLTNSTGNGTRPSADCCGALKNLTSGGRDCFCLIVTGNLPFQVPINRTLAISLPRACNMPSVPVQCRVTGVPVPAPAPGPVSPAPTPSPGRSPSESPKAPNTPVVPGMTPSPASGSGTTPGLTPPSPDVGSAGPTGSTGGSGTTPSASAAVNSCAFSPSLLLLGVGVLVLKYY